MIAGKLDSGESGPVTNPHTNPNFMDITLSAGGLFTQSMDEDDHGFVFCIDGDITIAGEQVHPGDLAVLGYGEQLQIKGEREGGRCLFVSGQRLREQVVKGGPFVMSTREEVLQAFEDYRSGQF